MPPIFSRGFFISRTGRQYHGHLSAVAEVGDEIPWKREGGLVRTYPDGPAAGEGALPPYQVCRVVEGQCRASF